MRWARVAVVLLAVSGSLIAVPNARAQELACRVEIDKSQLSGSDFDFLDDLERLIEEYMNTQNWTDDRFLPHERISCSMQVIMEQSTNLSTFDAQLILSSRRPIYNTAQSTLVLRINDSEWRFEYSRGTSLEFDLDRYNALTSVLDFYAYLILGYDYDTFSALGGTPYFEKARAVADLAQGRGDPGWSSVSGERNRVQLINELLEQRHRPLRRAYYQYHLKGLDQFVDNPKQAREEVLGALKSVRQVSREVSNSYALDLFFSAKSTELSAIFEEGNLTSRAYRLLTQIDPSHSSEYDSLVK